MFDLDTLGLMFSLNGRGRVILSDSLNSEDEWEVGEVFQLVLKSINSCLKGNGLSDRVTTFSSQAIGDSVDLIVISNLRILKKSFEILKTEVRTLDLSIIKFAKCSFKKYPSNNC
jgi:hypothetical protein